MDINQVLKRHKRILFLFSGGKDSTVALYHLKPHWDKLIVGWINTGDLCPEIVDFIQGISEQVPNFVSVTSDSIGWREENGWPSPVAPIDYTGLGQFVNGPKPVKISAYLDCCKANIWDQIQTLVNHTKATAVLTGQKDCDHAKDPRKNGVWINGAQYFYPIHDWSENDVRDYLSKIGITDKRFYTDDTSIDCRTCTGYPQYKARTAYIKEHHPEHYAEVRRRWGLIKKAVDNTARVLEEVTDEI